MPATLDKDPVPAACCLLTAAETAQTVATFASDNHSLRSLDAVREQSAEASGANRRDRPVQAKKWMPTRAWQTQSVPSPAAAADVLDTPPLPSLSWGLFPATLLSSSALLLFALRGTSIAVTVIGYGMLCAALLIAWLYDRSRRTDGLFRDLLLIAIGMVIVSSISVKADISWGNIVLVGIVLAAAVTVPYLVSRFVFKDRVIRFPWRGGWPWSRVQWGYIVLVLALGWLLLPFYFITSGVYLNWPNTVTWDEIARLFVGVNAVGTWDELFFIMTVFVLFKRHFPVWQANLLQMVIFVSFLWELGYQAWGPLLMIPFALLQGWIYSQTKSLPYVLTVHLLLDVVVFLVIVHARNDGVFPFFLVSP